MRSKHYLTFGILAALTAGAANAIPVEIQGNTQDLKWNAFQLLLQIGGIIAACFPLSGLAGVGIPMCALTTLAAFSTMVGLILKIFDGLIAKDDQLLPQVMMFLQNTGLRVVGQENLVTTMGAVSTLEWSNWANSTTAAEFRDIGTSIEFRPENVTNTLGEQLVNYCFSFMVDASAAPSHPLAPYRSTICASEVAISKMLETKYDKAPSKVMNLAMRPLKKFGIFESYTQVYDLIQGLHSVFGSCTEEFLTKSLALIEDLEDNSPDHSEKSGFEITDQVDGQQEPFFRIEIAKRNLL
ncbi:LAFA_0F17216g1_1 [Lachancea sp. 'fantastica']|nr:LAFA_0F17216g1_1 [Lachancea sp. 'fantastica']